MKKGDEKTVKFKLQHDRISLNNIQGLLNEVGLGRFQLNLHLDQKLGSTSQVYYAHDRWNNNRLVAVKFLKANYIDSFVSQHDLWALQTLQDCNYVPKDIIYNRSRNIFEDNRYVPIEQYVGELGRICPLLPISRCIEGGARRIPDNNCYVITFEYIPGQTLWENLLHSDFTYFTEAQAKRFVRIFISNMIKLLDHHLISCDFNATNYYYDDPMLTFIDFGWCQVDVDKKDDRNEFLLKSLENLWDRYPRIVQIFQSDSYSDFRYAVKSRQIGLRTLLKHAWLKEGEESDLE
ncbi:unnamed protein product [Didymodactylos carnosus]|uniref:Protein kinase domain-containing protein n=1 Tax=Didymodactylos carnosus TaxID=1234261 RepID=A0A814PL61_9BILA|nr:unnamed protein product [Didymodactylos carnosus]CAF1107550.1 unnamed protein product [Didymodactylos carnosus]CAF3575833.1 unnamed protein product [Didymodactylos carnosus]CAF3872107.1 unnamed protein product [Didymodactylos carnosus]